MQIDCIISICLLRSAFYKWQDPKRGLKECASLYLHSKAITTEKEFGSFPYAENITGNLFTKSHILVGARDKHMDVEPFHGFLIKLFLAFNMYIYLYYRVVKFTNLTVRSEGLD